MLDSNQNKSHPSHSLSDVKRSKRRYQVRSTPLQHIVIPSTSSSASSTIHGISSTWEDWHDHAWKESHHPSIGFRSLQEHRDSNNDNHTFPTAPFLFIRLQDEETIRRSLLESLVPLEGKIYYPRPSKNKNNKKTKKNAGKTHPTNTPAGSVVIPLPDLFDPPPTWKLGPEIATTETDLPFAASLPKVPPGKEVNIRTRKSFHIEERIPNTKKDRFLKHLNWATTNNPDGVPLVHDPIDQGTCGSCWAYVTTGSLETSLARRVAQTVYWQQLNQTGSTTSTPSPTPATTLTNSNTTNSTSWTNNTTNDNGMSKKRKRSARAIAQYVESLVFNQTRLSIQELLDCDTQFDKGCIGGNPLLAFFYIHKFGLMSWDSYPYAGTTLDTCARSDRREVSQYFIHNNNNKGRGGKAVSPPPPLSSLPLATVDSWGILPKNHEDMIQLALRFIGPVAVAINGGDDDFIRYAGGIFDKESCSQEANHAVLIVGFGQEQIEHRDGGIETIRYWIARNSWGPLWGENGYIRIARGSGKKKVAGICGIARSPSVALGGRLLFSPFLSQVSEETGGDGTSSSINNNGSGDGPAWWLDYNGGRGGDEAGNNYDGTGADEDFYHDFVDNQWPHFCNAITPIDTLWHVGCRRLIHVFDNHRAASLAVLSLLVLLLVGFLLTYPCRARKERRKLLLRQRQWMEQQHQHPEHKEGDEEQDPSGHGSLSISSDEDAATAAHFAILEDDLVTEDNHANEKVPLLTTTRQKSTSQQHQYGSVANHDHDDDTGGGSNNNNNNNNNKHNLQPPAAPPPPPTKESNEMASSLFSTSSGRSWFFLQK